MRSTADDLPTMGRKGTFTPNLIGNLLGFSISVIISLLYTPFLIRNLGTAQFGLVPLATTITSYLSLLTIAFTHSLARFLTIAIERENTYEANRIFNTSLFGGIAIVTVVVAPAAVLVYSFSTFAKIPLGKETDVTVLFALSISGFLLSVLSAPFNISTFVRNRLDLRTAGDVLFNLTRVSVVLASFHFLAPKLWQVGLGLFAAAVAQTMYSIWCSHELLPSLHIRLADAHWGTFKDLYRTSSWVIVDQLGGILCGGLDLLFANRLLGAQAGGEYAMALQWVSLLRGLGGSFASILAPVAIACFARNEMGKLTEQTITGMRLVGLCMAVPIGLLCGLAEDLLRLWVGQEFVHLANLMRLVTLPLSIALAATPLIYVLMALNDVKTPALWTIAFGVVDVLLILLFTGYLGWGLFGVALASATALIAKNLFFLPVYVCLKIGQPLRRFLFAPFAALMATSLVSILSAILARIYVISTWFDLGTVSIVTSALFSLIIYSAILNTNERVLVKVLAAKVAAR